MLLFRSKVLNVPPWLFCSAKGTAATLAPPSLEKAKGYLSQLVKLMRISKWQRLLRLPLALLILTIGCSESADWIASRITANQPQGKSCAVLVPGYPSKSDGTASPIQVLRVSAGVKAYRQNSCGYMVLSGAAVKNHIIEAKTMAKVAHSLGVRSDQMLLETQARNTWENIKLSIPLVEKYDRILVVSSNLHAQRARRYLCKQRPDLCDRTFVTVEYRPFERWWSKVAATFYEVFAWVRDLIMF